MKEIILKWYGKLKFPKEYDEQFIKALESYSHFDWTDVDSYDCEAHNPQENLFAYLYFCESLSKKYELLGIHEEILLDSLYDIVIWTKTWFEMKQEIGLAEPSWVKRTLLFKMFKLGRLQFGFGKFWKNYPEFLIEAGEDVIEVHIPETGKLQPKDCDESFKTAEIFFAKFFPTFSYRFYSCHSWLLDDSLENILGAKSNVCQFKARFQEIDRDESDAILRYVFRRDATRKNLNKYSVDTTLAKALKDGVKKGQKYYEVLGIITR